MAPFSGIGIRVGAQVASLRCPILRADHEIIPRKFTPSKVSIPILNRSGLARKR